MRLFHSTRRGRLPLIAVVLALPAIGYGAANFGVGDLWVADTSVPDTLQTQIIQTPADLSSFGSLRYEIGFSTREEASLGFLFDSITISLARADGTGSVNLVTADVFGLTIAPLAPNALLSDGGITVREITPRNVLLPDATLSFAYDVEVSLPPGLVGSELRTSFNFFNNGDEVSSRGYAMVVPEPSAGALLALICALGVFKWLWKGRVCA